MNSVLISDLEATRTNSRTNVCSTGSRVNNTLVGAAAVFLSGSLVFTSSYFPTSATQRPLSKSFGVGSWRVLSNPVPDAAAISLVQTRATPASTAELVSRLREDAGLTWEQLAKLFDVSRRSVHLWASGGKMNSQNQQHALKLVSLIDAIDRDSSQERRLAILTPDESGKSMFDAWKLLASAGAQEINPAAGPAAGLRV